MRCPIDQSLMRQIGEGGVSIDWCELCDGVWLDAGELTRLAHTTADLPTLPDKPTSIPSPQRASRFNCPRCQRSMEQRPYSDENPILIDRCPSCQGVWLDRGELQEIYSAIQKHSPTAVPPLAESPTNNKDPLAMMVLAIVVLVVAVLALAVLLFLTTTRR